MPEVDGPRRPVLLLVSQDVVDHRMAGPGLRYLEMARALSTERGRRRSPSRTARPWTCPGCTS